MSTLLFLIRGPYGFAFCYIFSVVSAAGLNLLSARALGPEGYGALSIARTFFQFVVLLGPLGLDVALQRFGSARLAEGRSLQPLLSQSRAFSFASGAIISISVCLGVPFIYGSTSHVDVFFVGIVLTMMAAPFTVDLAMLSTLSRLKGESWRYSLVIQITQPLMRISLTAVAIWLGPSVWSLALASSVGIALSWLLFAAVEREPHGTTHRRDAGLDRDFVQTGLVLGGSVLAAGLMRIADVFVLSLFVPAATLGAYAALSFVASLVQAVASAFAFGQGSKTAISYISGGPGKALDELRAVAWRAAPASLFLFGGVAVFGEHLSVVFGPGFEVHRSVAMLLAGANLVGGLLAVYGFALSMTGRHREEAAIMLSGCAVLTLALFLGASAYGAAGAAGALLAVTCLVQFARLAVLERVHSLRCLGRASLPLLLTPFFWGLAQAAQFIARQFYAEGWAFLLSGGALYTLICCILLTLTAKFGSIFKAGRTFGKS